PTGSHFRSSIGCVRRPTEYDGEVASNRTRRRSRVVLLLYGGRLTMLLWILRSCYGALILGTGLFVLETFNKADAFAPGLVGFAVVVALGGLVLVTDVLVRNKQITT